MKTVDAKGLSCPEPVLIAQDALKQLKNEDFNIEVSSATAKDNVISFLEKEHRQVSVLEQDDYFVITAKKEN